MGHNLTAEQELDALVGDPEVPAPTANEVKARAIGVDTSTRRRSAVQSTSLEFQSPEGLTFEQRSRRNHQKNEENYTFSEVAEAAFSLENPISSFLTWYDDQNSYNNTYDPDFDVVDALEARGKTQFLDLVSEVYNEEDLDITLDSIEAEERNKEIIASSGAVGTGLSIVAGIASPTTVLPVASVFGAGRTALAIGGNVAVSNSFAIAIDEAVLNYSQSTRTGTQSAGNILAGAVLGGILGTAGGALIRKGGDQVSRLPPEIEKNVIFTTPDGKFC